MAMLYPFALEGWDVPERPSPFGFDDSRRSQEVKGGTSFSAVDLFLTPEGARP